MKDILVIDGVEYVRKGTEQKPAATFDGMKYVIIRTYSAGVFAGYIKSRNGQEVQMVNARRIWRWDGAASLSQLAIEGVKNPENCKFAMPVNVELLQVIEILDCTEIAMKNIDGVKIWKI